MSPVSDEKALRLAAAARVPLPRAPLPRAGPPPALGGGRSVAAGAMWPRLAFCYWGLALVSGWATFQQLSPSRNFSFRLFPEAAPGAPGRLPAPLPAPEDAASESKVERLGQAFRRRVRRLRELSERLELVFLVDESSSVGHANFLSELKFSASCCPTSPWCPRPRAWLS